MLVSFSEELMCVHGIQHTKFKWVYCVEKVWVAFVRIAPALVFLCCSLLN